MMDNYDDWEEKMEKKKNLMKFLMNSKMME